MSSDSTAYGYCHCGCGEKTTISPKTRTERGCKKGEPIRFIHGHAVRRPTHSWTETDTGFTTPCWLWNGHIDRGGYPRLGGKSMHRELWRETNGAVPVGLELDHLCRVRHCVNPEHLEAVTKQTNVRRGALAKLTLEIAEQIRRESGSHQEIAERYGLHKGTVGRVRKGHVWVN